ncbi:hypothetical protein NRY68_16260 [Acidithiobacillus ferrooxidans]|uniref:hypothetical protein n=1 Tax=Acidithiobacillus ferrooxidans TaxID=920 RepID=UPI00214807A2|nr:hypothetical protein [Acidithiobacillus ferrooxidans]MCR1347304.1 hypothetical protein [Acidithiobacillus ferrooxidans]MCR1354835.1 hypothetical protein [Acidithiobacillus ferrooxidans]
MAINPQDVTDLPRIVALGKPRGPGGTNAWCALDEAASGDFAMISHDGSEWADSLAYVVFVNDDWIMATSPLCRDLWTFHRRDPHRCFRFSNMEGVS